MTGLPDKTLRQIVANRVAVGICPKSGEACSFNRSAVRRCEDEGRSEPPQPFTFPTEEYDGDAEPPLEAA